MGIEQEICSAIHRGRRNVNAPKPVDGVRATGANVIRTSLAELRGRGFSATGYVCTQEAESHRVNVVDERESAVPGVLQLAGDVRGPERVRLLQCP